MPHRPPNPHERRLLFSYLKQASSLAAWERVVDHHKVFVDRVEAAFEDTQRHPPSSEPPYIDWREMSTVFACHGALQAGVRRLRGGDRSCFRFLGTSGHFCEGLRIIEWWDDAVGRNEHMGGADFPPLRSSHWPGISQAMHECLEAYYEVRAVLQPRFTDVPAPLESIDEELAARGSPIQRLDGVSSLPEVPVLDPMVRVRTGEVITVDGIWEPVALRRFTGTDGLFRRAIASDEEQYVVAGCMNYLHGGFPAPTIAFPEDEPRREGKPTLWRLIWADDRYGTRGIPTEDLGHDFSWSPTVEPTQAAGPSSPILVD